MKSTILNSKLSVESKISEDSGAEPDALPEKKMMNHLLSRASDGSNFESKFVAEPCAVSDTASESLDKSESNFESKISESSFILSSVNDSEYKLLIDKRENAVYKSGIFKRLLQSQFNTLNVSIVLKQLTTSDFAITYKDNILLLIERKTWKDLSSTFKDKKRRFNYKKMIEEKDKSSSCIIIAYLIEGSFKTNRKSKIGRIPLSSLNSHLDHLMLEHNIHILKSRDKEDTAYRILELMKNILTMHKNKNPIREIDNSEANSELKSNEYMGGALKSLTANKFATDDTIMAELWSSVKQISLNLAGIFIENELNLIDMLTGQYKPNQIGSMRYPSGLLINNKRGKKIIDRYKKLLDSKNDNLVKDGANMLKSIPRISYKMANIILNQISLNMIINYIINDEKEKCHDKISNIRYSEKRKIGNKAAENIIKFLSKNRKK